MRVLAEFALWWLALTAGYLLLVSSPTGLEVPIGFLIGAVAAGAGVLARRAFRPPATLPRLVRRVVLLPLDVAGDVLSMTRLLVTGRALRVRGDIDEVMLRDDDATRVWAVLLSSAAPGGLAVDVETRDGDLVLRRHRLTSHQRVSSGWDTA